MLITPLHFSVHNVGGMVVMSVSSIIYCACVASSCLLFYSMPRSLRCFWCSSAGCCFLSFHNSLFYSMPRSLRCFWCSSAACCCLSFHNSSCPAHFFWDFPLCVEKNNNSISTNNNSISTNNMQLLIVLAIATYEEIKNAHEHSTARMRLGLRVSLLIGNIQICVLGYILQLRPIIPQIMVMVRVTFQH